LTTLNLSRAILDLTLLIGQLPASVVKFYYSRNPKEDNTFLKQPSEKFVVGVIFTSTLIEESISSIEIIAYNEDSNIVTSTIIEDTAIDGDEAKAVVKNGDDLNYYKITFTVTTTNGNIFEYDIIMNVLEM